MISRRTPGRIAPLLALGTALASATLVTWHVHRSHLDREEERFARTAVQISTEVTRRLDAYIAMLDATTGLFSASEYVSRDEFRRFVEQLDLPSNYSGIVSIGYAERLRAGDEGGVVRRIETEHGPEAAARASATGPGGFAVVYVEPMLAQDAGQIGANPGQNPQFLEAMSRARDERAPAISGRNRSGHASQAGARCDFFILTPIYESTNEPSTVEDRRLRFVGVLGARVCAEALLSGVFASLDAPAEFVMEAPGDSGQPERLYTSPEFDAAQARGEHFEIAEAIDVAGTNWTGRFLPNASFDAGAPHDPTFLVAILGGVISFLLFGLMRIQSLATQRSERDAAALRASQQQAMDSEARKGAILESAIDAIVTMDHEGKVLEWNAAADRMFGCRRDQAVGRMLGELIIPERDRERHRVGLRRFIETGVSQILGRRIETTAMRADGAEFPVELSVTRIGKSDPPRFTGFIRDITERARAERQRRLMTRELDHRVKNNLFAVMAILTESARRTDSIEALVESVSGRLHALARLHDLLARHSWERAELGELVAMTLAPYGPEPHCETEDAHPRVRTSGPPVSIGARLASSLCIALHELATNAAKYGALSAPQGVVSVEWRIESGPDGADRLMLRWQEQGGPPVKPPSRRGFGSELIEGGIRFEADGHSTLEHRPDGLVCLIDVPLGGPEPEKMTSQERRDALQ